MIIVLADDFSGAAEIGGIGRRYGLNTEVQLTMDNRSTADLIVVDTGTRAMSEANAVRKISEVSVLLSKMRAVCLFKKIDSVMRGHLIPELNSLQQQLNFKKVLLLPANPIRGRKILDGKYLVNGIQLNKTFFASDPDFPCTTADIASRIKSQPSTFQHIHVGDAAHMPVTGLVSGDVTSTADLKNYIAAMNEHDLCCGGAELFECFLEHLGYKPVTLPDDHINSAFTLVINGSTVMNQSEKELFDRLQIPQFHVPVFTRDHTVPNNDKANRSFEQIVDALLSRKVAVVSIAHPIHPDKAMSEIFLNYFVELIRYITTQMQVNDIHFCLTGGATASAVIRNSAVGQLRIEAEIAPGVVSLVSTSKKGRFTVKPGSYPWPQPWLEKLLRP